MASSGTYSWSPGAGDLALQALRRCGLKRAEITAEHLLDAANEANLLQAEWAARQPNLWLAETYSVTLTASQATETLPERIIAPLAVYISTTDGSGNTRDTILGPLSTTEYHSISDKLTEGVPSSYWFDRQITPEITLWPVPNDEQIYTLKIRALARPEDVVLKNGTNLDMPYLWLSAFADGLTFRLSIIHAPEKAQAFGTLAERSWNLAAKEDQEHVPMVISPVLDGYWR